MSEANNMIRMAAIQMCADFGEVDANLDRAARLVRGAFVQGAQWVILPEFFTSAMGFHPKMLDAARPSDGEPYQLLVNLARENSGVVGGSFISLRAGHAYNTFVLAFPDGSTFTHDKDLPTMVENCYYIEGNDDGVLDTPAGKIGAVLCWEFIRTQTLRRLIDKVGLVVGGSCSWDVPENFVGKEADELHTYLLNLLRDAPAKFARMLGVPVVHASHVGKLEGFNPPDEQIPFHSRFLGETQIVDGQGKILARRTYEEGEGIVLAEVKIGQVPEARLPIPERFWIPDHPKIILQSWEEQNKFGRDYYNRVTLPHRRALFRDDKI